MSEGVGNFLFVCWEDLRYLLPSIFRCHLRRPKGRRPKDRRPKDRRQNKVASLIDSPRAFIMVSPRRGRRGRRGNVGTKCLLRCPTRSKREGRRADRCRLSLFAPIGCLRPSTAPDKLATVTWKRNRQNLGKTGMSWVRNLPQGLHNQFCGLCCIKQASTRLLLSDRVD
ncbi:uncharacterized protein LOC144071835 [Stigmatopora argus]